MNLLNKSIALTVTFCLLGQTALVAAPATPDTLSSERVSLHEVQAQAQQDAAAIDPDTDKLKTVAPFVLSLGVAFCLLVHSWTKSDSLEKEIKGLMRELSGMQDDVAYLQKQQRQVEIQRDGWKRSSEVTHAKLNQQKVFNAQLEQQYREQIIALRSAWESTLKRTQSALKMTANPDPFVEKDVAALLEKPEVQKLLELDVRNFPADKGVEYFAQREKLATKALSKEPWFKTMTKEEQTSLIRLLEEVSRTPKDILLQQTSMEIVVPSFPEFMRTGMTASRQYAAAMFRGVLSKRGALGVFFLAFGFFSVSASAQRTQDTKMAQRIENDFTLFLKATPEEIDEMEKNPITYETCVRSAAVIHELATMDPQELKESISSLRRQTTRPTIRPIRAR